MKKLTMQELIEAPQTVQILYLNRTCSASMFKEALKNHPEYFPDEIEYRRKWAAIPDSVHESYRAQTEALKETIEHLKPPPGTGSPGMADYLNPDYVSPWQAHIDAGEKIRPQLLEIYRRHYEPHGVYSEKHAKTLHL